MWFDGEKIVMQEIPESGVYKPEPEPVAWELRAGKTDRVLIEITNNPERAHNWKASLHEVVPLYTAPRQWAGLTDKEIDHAAEQSDNYASFIAGALFAQDKLEEKNGG
jgi:hypothetical protein